jgi:hypothetical protein
MAQLDTNSRIKLDKKSSDRIEENEDSSSTDSSEEEKEKLEALKP